MDVDFAGGTQIRLKSAEGVDLEQLDAIADSYFGVRCHSRYLHSGVLQQGGPFSYLVLVPNSDSRVPSGKSATIAPFPTPTGFVGELRSKLRPDIEIVDIKSVGASVTGVTRQEAAWAALAGIVALFILLFWNYDGRIAVAIVIALVCDTTIALGAISWFSVPLSLSILSALLSVAGYSVYDSVVVTGHVNRDRSDLAKRRKQAVADLLEAERAASRGVEPQQYTSRDVNAARDRVRKLVFNLEAFERSLGDLSRRLLLTVLTTAVGAVGIAVFCEDQLQDFGIVMAAGAIFGMMSTVSIVARAMRTTILGSNQSTQSPPQMS